MVLFLLGLIFVTRLRLSRQSRVCVARVTVWNGQADGLALDVATLSAFLFSMLSIRLILREKKNVENWTDWWIEAVGILQSCSRWRTGAGYESCLDLNPTAVPHPSWIKNVLSLRIGRTVDWLSSSLLDLCIFQFPGRFFRARNNFGKSCR